MMWNTVMVKIWELSSSNKNTQCQQREVGSHWFPSVVMNFSCQRVPITTQCGNYQVPPKTHNVNRGRLVLTGFPQCCHMNSSCQRVPITTQCGNYEVPAKTSSSTKIQFPPICPHIQIPTKNKEKLI
uniref:Uncharacterized protein n=1 Tax=Cacopsylla melanoneura TaxID=428564 RepID=A0A8D9EWL6_9HEMI